MHRRALLAFGVLFLALFLVLAIVEGVGDPSVPSGDIALVDGVSPSIGEISQADLDHAIELAAAQAGVDKVPKPDKPKYDELKEAGVESLLQSAWIQGLAEEWGVKASKGEVARELEKAKKESFQTDAEFRKFLKEAHYTSADVDERLRIQVLRNKLQEQLQDEAPEATQAEVEDYYEAAKATQFTQKPSRDIRLVVNSSRKKAEAAFDALQADNSDKNWKTVVKKYSTDPTTSGGGGLQRGVQEGVMEEPLDADIFSASKGQVIGPVKTQDGYTVFEVVSTTPESTQKLEDVESQIESTLTQRLQEEFFTEFVQNYNTEWAQRTFCASGYVVKVCANFKGDDHPPSAPEGCYEADPETPAGACPAPVFQLIPALPGTVTPLEPKGKPLPQGPRPVESEETSLGSEGTVPGTGE